MSPFELAHALSELIDPKKIDQVGILSDHERLPSLRFPPVVRQALGMSVQQAHSLGMSAFDLKPYQEGDDLRYLDLKRYQKSSALLVRRFEDERSGALVIVLDASASMGCPLQTWKTALTVLEWITEATLRGGSEVYWLVEKNGELITVGPFKSLKDARSQFQTLTQLQPEGERAHHSRLAKAMMWYPFGCSCLYLTDLLGADVDLNRAESMIQLAQDRFPLPRQCRWSLCLRIEHKDIWAWEDLVTDPELGGVFQAPSHQTAKNETKALVSQHFDTWASLLNTQLALPMYVLKCP